MTENIAARLLLVEDTVSLSRMYAAGLEQNGYKVTAAITAHDAFGALAEEKYDLVLLDLQLPDMNGLEFMDQVNNDRNAPPVIVITGHGSIGSAVDAMRRGARDFLVKPFNMERLLGAIKSAQNENRRETMMEELAGIPQEGFSEPPVLSRQSGNAGKTTDVDFTGSSFRNITPEERPYKFGRFIGSSQVMRALYRQIESAAASDATVFITGESGTGKEICAEAIHSLSKRDGKPFIPINCAAIPRDLMESELFGHVKGAFTGAIADRDGAAALANGGTLFLDEIAEMSPEMQTKLLRFTQNLRFQKVGGSKIEKTDIRILCATNRNPLKEIEAGRFREDLFYRLHVLPIYMPPLRDRGNDVIDIARDLLQTYARKEQKRFTSLSPETKAALRAYHWPGNIRQLQNLICHAVVMHDAEVLGAEMLPQVLMHKEIRTAIKEAPLPGPLFQDSGAMPLAEIERKAIERAIEICSGNIPKAAALLEVSPSTIYRKRQAWEGRVNEETAAQVFHDSAPRETGEDVYKERFCSF